MEYFQNSAGTVAVALPFALSIRISDWESLRYTMVRRVDPAFTRDEWAYLVNFLHGDQLARPALLSFGRQGGDPQQLVSLFRPRPTIALWLPNNVSLLGPLTLILCSLTGAQIHVKSGSRATDLCQAFVTYARRQLPSKSDLQHYLSDQVTVANFDRFDPRNRTMAAEADVRIAFGSDASITEIHALPHRPDSIALPFGDHQSEVWVELAAMDDAAVDALISVFAIYGQTGCTSPRRVVVIDGTHDDCLRLRDALAARWPSVQREQTPMHVASQNVLHHQLALADGWQSITVDQNAAVLAAGSLEQDPLRGAMSLAIVSATPEAAVASLPANIQTVGHHLRDPSAAHWIALLAQTDIKRWVPLRRMHHFGPIWDGGNFWRQLFDEVQIAT
ncbi:hypothetical protein K0B96_03920 [Horticoccus luteus]|uniref:Long-chain-fatty-acyl-CoA reductase n=1 Tax=Horticoccus luteus TaxID=2862869 RepID=A0A8F9TXP6_9BACT|nr:acyl-CoA reductase [Horticoccus luteus]QYM79774.1 hypothetical protein K0B96_03920 [Horticoccus luteus]